MRGSSMEKNIGKCPSTAEVWLAELLNL